MDLTYIKDWKQVMPLSAENDRELYEFFEWYVDIEFYRVFDIPSSREITVPQIV